ncbi:MAG: methionine biosynthesis protein MetW [Rhodospirillales bacterium]|jgi:methionine biosynthesis protein MetW|nr:methionine biosynthesis protein MetW [Rhodospirillaceae bacterium]MDP6427850.1 methionine biosynthesis protein MetW [Rhodospirillales bacterium]MDP6642813.1 methionine biosynthesis protein MetW [Rhodospirillales bacterium]MDP6841265.1 methionine biosynthesis protein MetW [Rhodospirillales bacterium]
MDETDGRYNLRGDLQIIANMVAPGCRLLDVGCGDGALLDYLIHEKDVDGRGVELSMEGVNACVSHGLSVIQGDADTDLDDYPDGAFDYVVLSQTLQATRAPREVLVNMLRIGRRAIVSFPNFGHWRVRVSLMFEGRMPVTNSLPHQWYDSPNIHSCTIKDFLGLCAEMGFTIERSIALSHSGARRRIRSNVALANLAGEQAVFLLTKSGINP